MYIQYNTIYIYIYIYNICIYGLIYMYIYIYTYCFIIICFDHPRAENARKACRQVGFSRRRGQFLVGHKRSWVGRENIRVVSY